MYPAAAIVNDARKALKLQGFPAVKNLQKRPKRAALIVSDKIHKKASGHSSKITNAVDNVDASIYISIREKKYPVVSAKTFGEKMRCWCHLSDYTVPIKVKVWRQRLVE